MAIVLAQIYVLICLLFLAGKDATSYKLMEKDDPLTELKRKRVRRWHRDGVALNALVIVPIVYLRPELSWILLYALLLRLAIFDLAFNYWAGLNIRFLGSTAWADQIFSKIFGQYGAVKKSVFFLALLVLLNFLL
jgi:hypothetical protein